MSLDPNLIFADIDISQGLVVAVSGGSDSLALLLLLHDYLARQPMAVPLLAVTVDHGLRPESAAEASRVAAFCQARAIAHRIVVWQGDKPQSGISAAAREARYALLAQAATDAGAKIILTGHTLDDQAETLAMRALRGEGAGLAGMAAATLYDSRIWIVRPLLSLRRQALRDRLFACNIGWIDDPSNEDSSYERVRIRKNLSEADIAALEKQASEAGAARTDLSAQAGRLVARFMTRPAPGLFRLERDLFSSDTGEAGLLAFRAILATIGGTPHLPDLERSRSLFSYLATGKAQRATQRATLSRTLVDSRREGVFLWREARNLPQMTSDGESMIWDGRFRIKAPAGFKISPLAGRLESEMKPAVPASLALAALASEPGLFEESNRSKNFIGPAAGEAAIAHGVTTTPLIAPFSRFLPGFDLALATSLGRLVGAPPLAAMPWKHHIRADA